MSSPFAADPTAVRGAITPLVTPFTDDGALDLGAIKPLVDWQLEHGTHGISVGGSTGEPTSQTVAERIAVMRAAAAAIDGRVPFLPATGSALMDETLELTAEAAAPRRSRRAGRHARTTGVPSRRACSGGTRAWRPSSPTCRSSSTTCPSGPRSTSRRRRSGGYAGRTTTSSASRRRRATSSTSRTSSTRPGSDFIALSGIELLCYPMLCLGGAGHLSCVGNFAPHPVAELYDAFVAGDHERARALHYDLHPLVDAAFAETNPVPAKWVMEQLGLLACGRAREPLAPLGAASQERVRALLAASSHIELPAAVSS